MSDTHVVYLFHMRSYPFLVQNPDCTGIWELDNDSTLSALSKEIYWIRHIKKIYKTLYGFPNIFQTQPL